MTENTEKGWGFKPAENKEELPLSVDEPVAAEEVVVVEPVVEVPVVEAPVFTPVPTEAEEAKALQDAIAGERAKVAESKKPFGGSAEKEEAKALQDAIARERAKVAESKKPFDTSPDNNIERIKRDKELQKKIDSMYTIGMWGEHTKYECVKCPFSTLDEPLMRTHVKMHI